MSKDSDDGASGGQGKGGGAEGNARWWEGYLVRYFIGTLIGVLVLMVLAHAVLHDQTWYQTLMGRLADALKPLSVIKDAAPDGAKGADKSDGVDFPTAFGVLIGLAGFCYCYIASSPITVFHATRMIRRGYPLKLSPTAMWSWWLLLGLGLLATSYLPKDFPCLRAGLSAVAWWMAAPALYAFLSQLLQIALLIDDDPEGARPMASGMGALGRMLAIGSSRSTTRSSGLSPQLPERGPAPDERGAFEAFYMGLSRYRAPAVNAQQAADYRASYSHLREHSNSVFIVLLELSLGAVLWLAMRGQPDVMGRLSAGAIVLVLWLTPNVYLWGQANRLESGLQRGRLAGPPKDVPPV